MKNESGFIGKRYIQPDYYRKAFGNWAAVYIINDTEYHVQGISDPYDIEQESIEEFEVLKQNKDNRFNIRGCGTTFKSLKDALRIIEMLKEKERKNTMKKFIMAECTNDNTYKVVVADEEGKKVILNGEYPDFREADGEAKKEAENYKALYVNNR